MGAILVTGGTGYLGGSLVDRLASEGESVVVLARQPERARRMRQSVRVVPGDVTDRESIRKALGGCDRVIHAAAHVKVWDSDPGRFDAVNIGGLANLIEATRDREVSRILYTSSFIALGPTDGTTGDEDWEPPDRRFHNHYERTKAAADLLARREAARGVPLVILYPGVIYGPGRITEGNLVGKTIRDYLTGRLPGILGRGDRRFCYAFVDDVVEGHLLALKAAAPGERFILGGENRTLSELFAELKRLTGVPPPRWRIPYALAALAGRIQRWRARWLGTPPALTDEVVEIYRHEWAYSSRRAERRLGYRVTPFVRGLEAAVRSIQEESLD